MTRLSARLRSTNTTVIEHLNRPNPNEPFSHKPRVYRAICVLMLILIALYAGRGVWKFSTKPSIDMDKRWQEVHTLMRGVDPNTLHDRVKYDLDSFLDGSDEDDLPPYFEEYALPDRLYAIGVYPSYTYAMSIPLLWPTTTVKARSWFFTTTLASLLVIVSFVAAQNASALPGGESRGVMLLPLGTLCSSSIMDCIVTGNYTLLVVAALIGMFVSLQKDLPVLSGLMLSLAMIKPTIAVPFGLILLLRKRYWSGIVACIAALAFWFWLAYYLTGTSPIASALGALGHADQFVHEGGGLPAVVSNIGLVDVETSTIAVAVVVCSIGLLLLILNRRHGMNRAFAIAAVVSILCTYHRSYDHLVLIFLLLFIGRNILALKKDKASAILQSILFFAVIATVFLPTRLIGTNESINIYREMIWLACLTISILALRRILPGKTIENIDVPVRLHDTGLIR